MSHLRRPLGLIISAAMMLLGIMAPMLPRMFELSAGHTLAALERVLAR